jgi:ATP-binding cassette subfamily B (MDR/TAP) protein 6
VCALCFRYNIQYGRISAPDTDIVAAAKHADIHDRILTFPDAYETKVCPYTSDYPVY